MTEMNQTERVEILTRALKAVHLRLHPTLLDGASMFDIGRAVEHVHQNVESVLFLLDEELPDEEALRKRTKGAAP